MKPVVIMTFYFYSLPRVKGFSPYFKRLPLLLAQLSKRGIRKFKLWQGSHDTPEPLKGKGKATT